MESRAPTFSARAALEFGWRQTVAHLNPLLVLSLTAGLLAALSRGGSDSGGLLGWLVLQVAEAVLGLLTLRVMLRLHDGQSTDLRRPGELLQGFWPYLLTTFMLGLIVLGGLVLLIVPGVLWALRYGLAPALVADRGLRPLEALEESRQLTEGARGDLLVFAALALGVNLLGALALGVGLLLTIPTTGLAAVFVLRQLQARAGGAPTRPVQGPGARALPGRPLTTPGAASALALALAAVALASCTAGPNGLVDVASASGLVAGFWRGLWHGLIAPVSFVVSLFSSEVRVYEVHNGGGWYDLGFLLGVTSPHGGGYAARGRWSRRRPGVTTLDR